MKRAIIGLIILSFMFLTIMANIPSNDTENAKNQISNSSLLTDVQMAMVNGGTVGGCIGAIGGWLLSIAGMGAAAESGSIYAIIAAAGVAGIAWKNMANKCNFSY